MSTEASALAPRSGRLGIFISYASEDSNLAATIASSLKDALGEFPQVNFDKWFMDLGKEFRGQLQQKLQESDILIIVFTGVTKSYTGWEVGFFEGLKVQSDQAPRAQPKRLIPLYLGKPPEAVSSYQGVDLDILQSLLQLNYDDFKAEDLVPSGHPICQFIKDLQDTADKFRESAGWERMQNRPDPREAAKKIRLEVFRLLKGRVALERKVQQQITIELPGPMSNVQLSKYAAQLPPEARLIQVATGAADIAGLPNQDVTWENFAKDPGVYQAIWRDALTSIVLSYLQGSVDNSQVIVLPSQSAGGHPMSYRLILTTATRYFDDSLKFEFCVVQSLDREPRGNEDTTQVLNGLEIACRYRFMFLEKTSKFAWLNIGLARPGQAQANAYELRRELDLLRRDAIRAEMDQPAKWVPFIDVLQLQKMGEIYLPAEQSIRDLIGVMLQSTDADQVEALQKQLSDRIRELAAATESINAELINAMSKKLQELVQVERNN